jgi:hypothetical protein
MAVKVGVQRLSKERYEFQNYSMLAVEMLGQSSLP